MQLFFRSESVTVLLRILHTLLKSWTEKFFKWLYFRDARHASCHLLPASLSRERDAKSFAPIVSLVLDSTHAHLQPQTGKTEAGQRYKYIFNLRKRISS